MFLRFTRSRVFPFRPCLLVGIAISAVGSMRSVSAGELVVGARKRAKGERSRSSFDPEPAGALGRKTAVAEFPAKLVDGALVFVGLGRCRIASRDALLESGSAPHSWLEARIAFPIRWYDDLRGSVRKGAA